MSFVYNMMYRRRDQLLGLEVDWKAEDDGGIQDFEGLGIDVLNELIRLMFLNPEGTHNNTPCYSDIQKFMTQYPQVKASGYAVSPLRDDYRTSIIELYLEHDDITD